METIFVETGDKRCINYPVGDNILESIPKIMKMIEGFESIQEFKGKFVNLICRGSSGAIIAAFFAANLKHNNLKIVHVKKEGESSHCTSYLHEGHNAINVIVDDFIFSGETLNTIAKWVGSDFIDCVCVTGLSYQDKLIFTPRYMVCGIKKLYTDV